MARKNAPTTGDQRLDSYIRDTLLELAGKYDREALNLICGPGIFCVADPCLLAEAVGRLAGIGPNGIDIDKVCQLQEQAAVADTVEARHAAICGLEEAALEELEGTREAAYLLGIAVGRRLGSGPLKIGGAR